jgi:F-type H+-transporting ATPase subunit a
MPEELWITALLNHWFASSANAVLAVIGIHAKNPSAPIDNAFAMEVLVFGLLVGFFCLVRAGLSVDRPGAWQHTVEWVESFVNDQSHGMIGHGSEAFTPFLVSLGLFILISNLIGLVPGFESPTASPAVTLGCAFVAWVYYQAHAVRLHGVGYIKHFLGPVWWLAPLMILIEVISHLARLMSLTIRLFANIFAGDMVTLVIFSLIPIGLPVAFLAFHIGVSFLQTYIFVLLTTIYLAGSVSEAH